jgi:hypothetical protein
MVIDHVLGSPAVIAPYVTNSNALQIRLPQETAQHITAAIPNPNGAQSDSFAWSHTAVPAQRRTRYYLRHRQAYTGFCRGFEKPPPVYTNSFAAHT